MNDDIRKLVLLNPNMLKAYDFHGVELAAYAFEIMLYQKGMVSLECDNPRDKSGHFYGEDGAACPHKSFSQTKETAESVKRKESGVKAVKEILSGKSQATEMRTASGQKVIFQKGTEKYGIVHMRLRRFNSGDVKTQAEFDKLIDGVVKALATAEPYKTQQGRNTVFDYNEYRAVCRERNGELMFISGYKIEKGADELR